MENFAPVDSLIQVGDLLQNLVTVLGHFLIDDASTVDVILDKFLFASELDMLEHQLGHVVAIIEVLEQILLHLIVVCGDALDSSQGAGSILSHGWIIRSHLVNVAAHRNLLEERW